MNLAGPQVRSPALRIPKPEPASIATLVCRNDGQYV